MYIRAFVKATLMLLLFLFSTSYVYAQCTRCGDDAACKSGYDHGGDWCITECFAGECTCWTSGDCSSGGPPRDSGGIWGFSNPADQLSSRSSTSNCGATLNSSLKSNNYKSTDFRVHSDDISKISDVIPELGSFLRATTINGVRDVPYGPLNGVAAIEDSEGIMRNQYRMYGFVDGDHDGVYLELIFQGHPELDSASVQVSRLYNTRTESNINLQIFNRDQTVMRFSL